jgi:septum formation topological specificity factor MinE
MQMKKDPNADPDELRKLKKTLLESPSSSAGLDKTRSIPSNPGDAIEPVQEKVDLLMAQYMKLKGDPDSDPVEMKRLKGEIEQLKGASQGQGSSSKGSQQDAESRPALGNESKSKAGAVDVPVPEENGSDERRQRLKALYLKMKADPNADPKKLEKLKAEILSSSSKAKEPKSVAFDVKEVSQESSCPAIHPSDEVLESGTRRSRKRAICSGFA